MKPFDLEKAKAGHPVCTRDGKDVRIICWDRKFKPYPIVTLVLGKDGNEYLESFTEEGCYYLDREENLDLFLKDANRVAWTNIYHDGMGNPYNDELFESEGEAKTKARKNVVKTIKVEWEE